jgi:hypothetical protein
MMFLPPFFKSVALLFSMSWYSKEHETIFDRTPIEGLFFLHGDVISRQVNTLWTIGMKYPLIAFPSGLARELWDGRGGEQSIIVHLFGEMDLPLIADRDHAFEQANDIARQVGYRAEKRDENALELWGHDIDEHLLITYDNQVRRMLDVVLIEPKPHERHPAPRVELLDDETREKLPKLYSNETQGLDALAQVKYFTPDGGFTWYASEGSPVDEDGYYDTDKGKVDFVFFGLVAGLEVELGYFSLSQLESVRGGLGLPVERDRFYEPKSLRALKEQHERERNDF